MRPYSIKTMQDQLENKMAELRENSQGKIAKDTLFQKALCYVIEKNRPELGDYFFMTSGYDEFTDGVSTTGDIVDFVLTFNVEEYVNRAGNDSSSHYPDHKDELQEIINSVKKYVRDFMGLDQPHDPNELIKKCCLTLFFTSTTYDALRRNLQGFYDHDSRAPKKFIESIFKLLDDKKSFWKVFFLQSNEIKHNLLIGLKNQSDNAKPYRYGPNEKEFIEQMLKVYDEVNKDVLDQISVSVPAKPGNM